MISPRISQGKSSIFLINKMDCFQSNRCSSVYNHITTLWYIIVLVIRTAIWTMTYLDHQKDNLLILMILTIVTEVISSVLTLLSHGIFRGKYTGTVSEMWLLCIVTTGLHAIFIISLDYGIIDNKILRGGWQIFMWFYMISTLISYLTRIIDNMRQ